MKITLFWDVCGNAYGSLEIMIFQRNLLPPPSCLNMQARNSSGS